MGLVFGLRLAVPIHQGPRAHIDVGGDAHQAPAFGPQFDGLAFGVGAVHRSLLSVTLLQFRRREPHDERWFPTAVCFVVIFMA